MMFSKVLLTTLVAIVITTKANSQKTNIIVPILDSSLNKYGYINVLDSSKFVIPPKYNEAHPFYSSYAKIKIDSLYGIINLEDSIILQPCFKEMSSPYKNLIITKDSIVHIRNTKGKILASFDSFALYKNNTLYKLPVQWEEEVRQIFKTKKIQDWELIYRVLSMYQKPEERYNALIGISLAYDKAVFILIDYFIENYNINNSSKN